MKGAAYCSQEISYGVNGECAYLLLGLDELFFDTRLFSRQGFSLDIPRQLSTRFLQQRIMRVSQVFGESRSSKASVLRRA